MALVLIMVRLGAFSLALLLPALALAQGTSGPYVSGTLGLNFAGSMLSDAGTTNIDTDAGPAGLAALGWRFGNGLRAELEGSVRSNDIDGIQTLRVNGLRFPLGATTGTENVYAAMANLAYDLPFHPFGLPLQPYIGGGLGYGWLDLGSAHGNGFGAFGDGYTGPDLVSFSAGGAFAYQAMAGFSLPLQILPGLALTLEDRFFGMARADVAVHRVATAGGPVNGVTPFTNTRNGFEVKDNAILVGLRYQFGP